MEFRPKIWLFSKSKSMARCISSFKKEAQTGERNANPLGTEGWGHGGIFILSMIPLSSLLPCSISCLLKSSCQCLWNKCQQRRDAATDLTIRPQQKVSRISLVVQTCINSCIVVVLAPTLQLKNLLAPFPGLNYYHCSPCLQVNEHNTFGEASSNVFVLLGFCTFLVSS